MRIIHTDKVEPGELKTQTERDWVYNGIDSAVTIEVLEAILPQLDNLTTATYAFSKALQGPALEMRLRGVLIDARRRYEVRDALFEDLETLERQLERIVLDGVGMPAFNWGNNDHLKELFYERLRLPPIKKGGRLTTDRAALERMEEYLVARQICAHLIQMREIRKKIGFLNTGIDPDGRMRTSYNIAGTSTGRFSSSYSDFGTGTNLQNIEEKLRPIFIADKGKKLAKFDAKSGESYCVGAIEWNLFKDARYLEACESGDPHTATARICWPKLPWTGNLAKDKKIAEQPYYRHYDYRFMCKKLGHGSNYGGKPQTLASQAKIPVTVVSAFQSLYFLAYPAHLIWHQWVDRQLREHGYLITLTGRKRQFWGRRNSDDTLREAIAYDPQGSLADVVNRAMLFIWKMHVVELYMHDHDALTFQFPEEIEDEIVPKLLEWLKYPVPLEHGRTMLIPYDAQTGWNRGKYCCGQRKPECGKCNLTENIDGLKDWVAGDKRKRQKEVHILDRKLR